MTPISYNDKTIAVGQLLLAMNCQFAGLATPAVIRDAERSRTRRSTTSSLLGLASHKFAAGLKDFEILEILRNEAPALTDAELFAIMERTIDIGEAPRRGGNNLQREKTISWRERQSGWTIFSKPDREWTSMEGGRHYVITDLSMPPVVHKRHIDKVRLHGLVRYMKLFSEGVRDIRVKLRIESLVVENSHEEWLQSHHDVVALLASVQDTLQSLIDVTEAGEVPSRVVGGHCFGCKLREQCEQGRDHTVRKATKRGPGRHLEEVEVPLEVAA